VVSQFGLLENIVLPPAVRRVEMRPYIVSQFHRGPATAGDPFFDGTHGTASVGSDFRLGLGSAFTVDATVNPDFGQVEADPAVINLTAFESFFDERRPFFVEDGQVFEFPLSGSRLFYSRRIGRAPHGSAPDGADFEDIPGAATILGAAKVTGRTAGGLSVGALTALTQAETGRAFFAQDGSTREFGVEPRTEFAAFSARQDLNDGASQVSGIFTAVHRDLPGTGEFDDLVDQAYTVGARFEHQWANRTMRLTGFLAGSRINGDPQALIAVQKSSTHYFQRPDATRFQLDSTATSLSGREWRLQLDRVNTSVTGGIWLAEITKGFEINDFGFSSARERLDGGVRLGYLQIRPGRVFRDYSVNFFSSHNISHDALDDVGSWQSWRRAYVNGNFNLGSNFTFLNYNGVNANVSWQPDQYSRFATRGGPIMIQPGSVGVRMGFGLDRRKAYSGNIGVNYQRGGRDSGNDISVNANVTMRPSPPLQIQIEPSFGVQTDGGQYVTSTSTLPYSADVREALPLRRSGTEDRLARDARELRVLADAHVPALHAGAVVVGRLRALQAARGREHVRFRHLHRGHRRPGRGRRVLQRRHDLPRRERKPAPGPGRQRHDGLQLHGQGLQRPLAHRQRRAALGVPPRIDAVLRMAAHAGPRGLDRRLRLRPRRRRALRRAGQRPVHREAELLARAVGSRGLPRARRMKAPGRGRALFVAARRTAPHRIRSIRRQNGDKRSPMSHGSHRQILGQCPDERR
jgi:hypothetical protein